MASLVHLAQADFTKGRSVSSNNWKVAAVLEHVKSHPSVIVTLDAEKAFDNVSFQCLYLVLQRFGFSGPFQHLITSMYSTLSIKVIAAGYISDTIILHKGTRQGCPLLAPLFKLALESLSCILFSSQLYVACRWVAKGFV